METVKRLDVEHIAAQVCREVAELPDRSSPKDWPEAMLVTHDELSAIVRAVLARVAAAPAAVQPVAQQQPSVHQVVGSGLPSQAVRTGGEGAPRLNFEFEALPPLEGIDRIYAEYAKSFGRHPDAFMARIVAQTKEDLFVWWASHREDIRAALEAAELARPSVPTEASSGATGQDEHKPGAMNAQPAGEQRNG